VSIFLAIMRRAGRLLYDHLGMVVLSNLVWMAVVTLPPATARLLGAQGWVLVMLALSLLVPANASLWYVARQIAREDDPGWRDLVTGIRQYCGLSLRVTALWLLGVGLFTINIWFYQFHGARYPMLHTVAVFWCFALAYFLLVMLFSFPFVLEQRIGAWSALRKSWLLTADTPAFTGLFALALAAWSLCTFGPVIGRVPFLLGVSVMVLVFGYLSAIAVTAQVAFIELMRRYEEAVSGESKQTPEV
jgi:hypothetical protein